jgi:glycine betaine/choline ABC-type transport system substrate-binding protein
VRYSVEQTMIRHLFNCLAWALLLTSCSQPKAVVVVGSMNGTEQRLLGEMVAQHLERRLEGAEIRRQFAMGDTPIAYQSLLAGQIDLYPEYTGAIIAELLMEVVPSDPAVALERARAEMARRSRIDVLNPFGFDARWVFVVRASDTQGISTIDQAATGSLKWNPGASLEFQGRSDGLPNFNAYRLPLSAAVRGLQPEQLFAAMARGEINMVVAPQTDSHLTETEWKILEDNRNLNSPQQAAVLVSQDTIQQQPRLRPALEELTGKLTVETMRKLNAEVDLKERPVPEVAAEFLRAIGL